MGIAEEPDGKNYIHFNAFFTRALKGSARSFSRVSTDIICPVDGSISQIGSISNGTIFQAKNRSFMLKDLLANDAALTGDFNEGEFVTLYLSPRDYHRVHMPFDGTLRKMIYVPGRLFAVNRHTTAVVNRLFSRNERVICIFDTVIGPMALILIGAIFVGSMETVWAGEITPASVRSATLTDYDDQSNPITYEKGEEIGRFNMGSTVIILYAKDRIHWLEGLGSGDLVKMGMTIGTSHIS